MDTGVLLLLAVAVTAIVTFLGDAQSVRVASRRRPARIRRRARHREAGQRLAAAGSGPAAAIGGHHPHPARHGGAPAARGLPGRRRRGAARQPRCVHGPWPRTTFEGYQKDASGQMEPGRKPSTALVQPLADALRKVEARLGEAETRTRQHLRAPERAGGHAGPDGADAGPRAADTFRPRTMGRTAAAARRRDGRHAPPVRLRRAAEPAGRSRAACGPTSSCACRAASRSWWTPRRPSRRSSTRTKPPTRRVRAERLVAPRATGAGPHGRARQQGLLGSAPGSPEMVVLFLPGETLFSTALQQDLSLIERGLKNRVLLASPITLIALLTTIARAGARKCWLRTTGRLPGWVRSSTTAWRKFVSHFDDVREQLDGAVQALQRGRRLARVPGAGERPPAARARRDVEPASSPSPSRWPPRPARSRPWRAGLRGQPTGPQAERCPRSGGPRVRSEVHVRRCPAARIRAAPRFPFARSSARTEAAAGTAAASTRAFRPSPTATCTSATPSAICLNFGLAARVRRPAATCGSTTPTRRRKTSSTSTRSRRDVRWLGFDWADRMFYASDYFEQLYDCAERADPRRAWPTSTA